MGVIGIIFLFYLIILYLVGVIIFVIILFENRDFVKIMFWLLMFIIFLGVGLMIYVILGRNIRKRKLFKI